MVAIYFTKTLGKKGDFYYCHKGKKYKHSGTMYIELDRKIPLREREFRLILTNCDKKKEREQKKRESDKKYRKENREKEYARIKRWQKQNPEKYKKQYTNYRKKNIKKINERDRNNRRHKYQNDPEYRQKVLNWQKNLNKLPKYKQKAREWRENNKEKTKKKWQEWYQNNREHRRKYERKYYSNEDNVNRKRERDRFSSKIKKGVNFDELGCSNDFFNKWLDFILQKDDNIEIEIDHIYPLSKLEKDDIRRWHWTNLCRITKSENKKKGSRILPKIIEKYRRLALDFIRIYYT